MKKEIDTTLFLTTAICFLPLIFSIIVYPSLPNEIAIHYNNTTGVADNYVNRAVAAFVMPLIIAVFSWCTCFALDLNPKKRIAPRRVKQMAKWLVPMMAVIYTPMTLFIGMGKVLPATKMIPAILGVLLIAAGNNIHKCKKNGKIGIKLPSTLKSEKNWTMTHKMASYIFIIGGAIMIITSFLSISLAISVLVIILCAVLPCYYSISLNKKEI